MSPTNSPKQIATNKLCRQLRGDMGVEPMPIENWIAASADVNGYDKHGMKPLHYAAYAAGSTDADIETLLDYGADVNAQSRDGGTSLMVAASVGRAGAVRILLSRGANVNEANGNHAEGDPWRTALSIAQEQMRRYQSWGSPLAESYGEVIRLLLSAGATSPPEPPVPEPESYPPEPPEDGPRLLLS